MIEGFLCCAANTVRTCFTLLNICFHGWDGMHSSSLTSKMETDSQGGLRSATESIAEVGRTPGSRSVHCSSCSQGRCPEVKGQNKKKRGSEQRHTPKKRNPLTRSAAVSFCQVYTRWTGALNPVLCSPSSGSNWTPGYIQVKKSLSPLRERFFFTLFGSPRQGMYVRTT